LALLGVKCRGLFSASLLLRNLLFSLHANDLGLSELCKEYMKLTEEEENKSFRSHLFCIWSCINLV